MIKPHIHQHQQAPSAILSLVAGLHWSTRTLRGGVPRRLIFASDFSLTTPATQSLTQ